MNLIAPCVDGEDAENGLAAKRIKVLEKGSA
jgi:hypothetical protein